MRRQKKTPPRQQKGKPEETINDQWAKRQSECVASLVQEKKDKDIM